MKKILFFILLALLASMPAAYAFTDVADSDGYASSVQRLSDFGIINGFSDGSYSRTKHLQEHNFQKLWYVCWIRRTMRNQTRL
jgi:transposase